MRRVKLIFVVLSVALAIVACGGVATNNAPSSNGNQAIANNGNGAGPASANADRPATAELDGKQLYTESCQICHRDTGKGGPVTVQGKKLKPADLTAGHAKKHSDDDLVKDIQEGSPEDGMPAFKNKLKPEEIKAIVGYIRNLQQQ